MCLDVNLRLNEVFYEEYSKLKVPSNPQECYKIDESFIATWVVGIKEPVHDKKEWIEKNINSHVYLALHYLAFNKGYDPHGLDPLFIYNTFIKGLDYFKSYCPNRLLATYTTILYNNFRNFTSKQIEKIIVKIFFYLLHNGDLNISTVCISPFITLMTYLAKVSNSQVKFIIWNIYRKEFYNEAGLIVVFQDLLTSFDQLNKYEQKVLREHGINYFIASYSTMTATSYLMISVDDKHIFKKIYEQLVKLFPEDEGKLKLTLLSLQF